MTPAPAELANPADGCVAICPTLLLPDWQIRQTVRICQSEPSVAIPNRAWQFARQSRILLPLKYCFHPIDFYEIKTDYNAF